MSSSASGCRSIGTPSAVLWASCRAAPASRPYRRRIRPPSRWHSPWPSTPAVDAGMHAHPFPCRRADRRPRHRAMGMANSRLRPLPWWLPFLDCPFGTDDWFSRIRHRVPGRVGRHVERLHSAMFRATYPCFRRRRSSYSAHARLGHPHQLAERARAFPGNHCWRLLSSSGGFEGPAVGTSRRRAKGASTA